jgi:predicted transcriptional regulator
MNKTDPCGLSKERIEQVATQVATDLGCAPGADLLALVRSWGHNVTIASTAEHPESLVISPDGVLNIFLPEHTSPARDTFTIAHEIGHFILHHDAKGEEVRYNRSGTDRAEVEANWFAAAFLMPRDHFVESCSSKPLHMVAREFRVSLAAAEVRARSLGITPIS